ncbi:MAG: tetratricopeptide repeat protein [Cyanobacteria bacterium SZAS LIN-3]|nr:tetratricopeptide repeat protein [Cyanobacteria bacterium SZAS LIN-3]
MQKAGAATKAFSRGQETQFTADAKRCMSLLKQAESAYLGGKIKRHDQLAGEALKLARRSKELQQSVDPDNAELANLADRLVLASVKALGLSYWNEETPEGNQRALPLLTEARELLEAAAQPDYASLFEVYEALCQLYVAMKRLGDYEDTCRRALNLKEKQVGQWHPDVINYLVDLGWALEEQNKYAESASIKKDALALSLQHRGEADTGTISLKHGVAYTTFLAEGMTQFDAIQKALSTLTVEERKKFSGNVAAELQSLR